MTYNNENWKGTSIYDFIKFHNEHKKPIIDIDLNREVYNSWTVGNIINNLHQSTIVIMAGSGWTPKFKTVEDLTKWLNRNFAPYYSAPEVIEYFTIKYKLKDK